LEVVDRPGEKAEPENQARARIFLLRRIWPASTNLENVIANESNNPAVVGTCLLVLDLAIVKKEHAGKEEREKEGQCM
jgi:hypothetical protein